MLDMMMGIGNPYSAAMDTYDFDDMQSMLMEYYGPWRDAGLRALPTLEEQYMMLLNNPAGINQMMGSTYQQSPGYDYQMQQSMNAANQSAAAGGMLGTPSHQNQAMTQSQNIANQDYWQYVNHLTGLYNQGLGVAGNINQMGYNASDKIASDLARFMGAEMQMAGSGTNYNNQFMQALLGGASYALGGPAGGAMGGMLGGMM